MRDTVGGDTGYEVALHEFDIAICEARAVAWACANRLPLPNVSYATRIFALLCAHAEAVIRLAPRSRWVRADFESWDFTSIAPHGRAILEGYLSFVYLMEPTPNPDEVAARINVMHLNDCTRRIQLIGSVAHGDVSVLVEQQTELRRRLEENAYFSALPDRVKKACLQGEKPWIKSREQLLEMVGFPLGHFSILWLLYSQHSHLLPLAFHRIEENGRGTGVKNEVDRDYLEMTLAVCASVFHDATSQLVIAFPDTARLRRGLDSKFFKGPLENARVDMDRSAAVFSEPLDMKISVLATAITHLVRVVAA